MEAGSLNRIARIRNGGAVHTVEFQGMRKLAAALAALTMASCSMLESVERELVFRPVTDDWRGYAPGIVNAEEHWIAVGT